MSKNVRAVALLWLTVAALIAGSLLSAPRGGAGMAPVLRARERPNILLLSIDGVDADRLSAYGYEKPTSPFLESL